GVAGKNLLVEGPISAGRSTISIDLLRLSRCQVMPNSSHNLLHYLRMAVGAYREDARTDAELLARFAETRDEVAFAALVWRHGALVWGTCRRILGNTPDAEDAFQTTFLDLARQADCSSVKSLAGWLHQVARRIALQVQLGTRR